MRVDYLEIACFQAKNAQKHNSGESTVKDLRVANGPELNRPAHFLQENSEAFLLRAGAEPLPHPHDANLNLSGTYWCFALPRSIVRRGANHLVLVPRGETQAGIEYLDAVLP